MRTTPAALALLLTACAGPDPMSYDATASLGGLEVDADGTGFEVRCDASASLDDATWEGGLYAELLSDHVGGDALELTTTADGASESAECSLTTQGATGDPVTVTSITCWMPLPASATFELWLSATGRAITLNNVILNVEATAPGSVDHSVSLDVSAL